MGRSGWRRDTFGMGSDEGIKLFGAVDIYWLSIGS